MVNRSRILIADDHNLVAELCKGLLETEFDVVGVVGNGHALSQTPEARSGKEFWAGFLLR